MDKGGRRRTKHYMQKRHYGLIEIYIIGLRDIIWFSDFGGKQHQLQCLRKRIRYRLLCVEYNFRNIDTG